MPSVPGEGIRDLRGRLRIAWLWALRFRIRRALFQAEAELGFLAWEQVEFYDDEVIAAVKTIQEFEETQANLQNTTAELSKRNAALDEELARETSVHDQTQATLVAQRAPIAAQLQDAETTRRQKLEAIERFQRALQQIARVRKDLEAQSLSFLKISQPSLEVRTAARKISDDLTGLSVEESLVITDKDRAAAEASAHEAAIVRLSAELKQIDTATSAARDTLAEATRRIAAERRQLDRQKKQSTLRMSHLDRKKQQPYRFIGACLADHAIAPLNQPAVLQKVLALRQRNVDLTDSIKVSQSLLAAADPAILIAFYLLLTATLFALLAIASHLLH